MADLCVACGSPSCPGRVAVDYCPQWQEAETRRARGEYLATRPLAMSGRCWCGVFHPAGWVHASGAQAAYRPLTPSADVPACRDEDPAQPGILAACYPDPPEYQHPEDDDVDRS